MINYFFDFPDDEAGPLAQKFIIRKLATITSRDRLISREEIVIADRECKLKEARERRCFQKTESSHVDIQALELAPVAS